jgi:antitoxin (DNA-binding transcriptional repressor) of toxin-antitoxin stability system
VLVAVRIAPVAPKGWPRVFMTARLWATKAFLQLKPVIITRHGCTTAFMVPAKDMQLLQDLKRQNAVTAFEAWSQAAASTGLPAAPELTDEAVVRMVKQAL